MASIGLLTKAAKIIHLKKQAEASCSSNSNNSIALTVCLVSIQSHSIHLNIVKYKCIAKLQSSILLKKTTIQHKIHQEVYNSKKYTPVLFTCTYSNVLNMQSNSGLAYSFCSIIFFSKNPLLFYFILLYYRKQNLLRSDLLWSSIL